MIKITFQALVSILAKYQMDYRIQNSKSFGPRVLQLLSRNNLKGKIMWAGGTQDEFNKIQKDVNDRSNGTTIVLYDINEQSVWACLSPINTIIRDHIKENTKVNSEKDIPNLKTSI